MDCGSDICLGYLEYQLGWGPTSGGVGWLIVELAAQVFTACKKKNYGQSTRHESYRTRFLNLISIYLYCFSLDHFFRRPHLKTQKS